MFFMWEQERQGGDLYGYAQIGLYVAVRVLYSTNYLAQKYLDGAVGDENW